MTMKNNIKLPQFLFAIIWGLTACSGPAALPAATAASTSRFEAVATATIQLQSGLPVGWKMDENPESKEEDKFFMPFYEKYGLSENMGHRTGYIWTARPERIPFNKGQLGVREIEELNSTIEVTMDKALIKSFECGPEVSAYGYNLITYWVYEDHWIVELICHGHRDIMLDGKLLNSTNGYTSSFSPYLVAGKLFFFFERGDEIGFFYDRGEYLLDFDEVSYAICCGISELNPAFYEEQVMFMGMRDGVRHYVVVGNLDLP